jgi:hypothetical protein
MLAMSMRAGVAGCVLFAGCAFEAGRAPQSERTLTIVDDSAAELATGTLDGAAVDSLGWLAPEAYANGGLHVRAYGKPGMTATTSWADVAAIDFGPLLGERYGELPVANWMYDRPYGLGLTGAHTDNFTLLYDGEIHLAAGTTIFELAADDYGLFELDLGTIKASAHPASYDGTQRFTISAPHDGWYPIHAALSESSLTALFQISIVEAGIAKPITADRLRARVTSAQGLTVTGTNDRLFRAPLAGSSIEHTFIDRDFTNVPPSYDLPTVPAGNYGLRYTGQLRVDQTDLYVFGLDLGPDPTDYARLLIDGIPVAGHWPGGVTAGTSEAIELTPGWHDVLLDYSQTYSYARLRLTMSSPTVPTQPIAAERLRPVSRTGLLAMIAGIDTPLVDATPTGPGVAMVAFPISAPAGTITDFVDYFFYLGGATPRTDLQVTLRQPGGAEVLPLLAAPPFETYYDELPNISGFAGKSAGVGWQAVFTDTVPNNGGGGYLQFQALRVTYHGGPGGPFAKQMTYVSSPHATATATRIDAIRVSAKLDGAQLAIAMRSGDAGWIEQAPWVDVAPGEIPAIDAGTLLQYRLTVISDGWQYPTIDKVEIDYTQPAP